MGKKHVTNTSSRKGSPQSDRLALFWGNAEFSVSDGAACLGTRGGCSGCAYDAARTRYVRTEEKYRAGHPPRGSLDEKQYVPHSEALSAAVPAGDGKFSSSSAIGQFNSVLDIGHSGDTAFFLQTTARHVDFEVSDLLKASVKRLDLGVIAMRNSSAGNPQYLGLSVITEDNTGRPQFVDGYRIGDGVGLRLEGGSKISDAWAVSFRSEFLNWQGENGMNRPNLMPQPIVNPIDNGRMFSNVDIIRAANAFGGRGQWRTGLHYLSNQYEPQQNNFGMTVTEPFGDHERLGFFRTGYLQMWPLASIPGAMAYVEANIDREFEHNMDQFLSDKTIVSAKVGVNWAFAPSRQLLLEWQWYNGTQGIQSRNGLLMTILLDDL